MKKIIILAIATLSTGVVLSSTLKKPATEVKPVVTVEKSTVTQKTVGAAPSSDALGVAD